MKRLSQSDEGRLEGAQSADTGDPQSGGIGVVGRLVEVQILQRVHLFVGSRVEPKQHQRAVTQNLVHGHVGGRPRAPLECVDPDLRLQYSSHQLLTGAEYGRGGRRIPAAQLVVGPGAGQLHRPIGP